MFQKSSYGSGDEGGGEDVKNLEDTDFKNMLDSAVKPCYRSTDGAKTTAAENGQCSPMPVEESSTVGQNILSSDAALILNNIRQQAEQSKAAADAGSILRALFVFQSN